MDGYKQNINLQIVSTNHVKCWIKLHQCMSFLNALIYDYAISFPPTTSMTRIISSHAMILSKILTGSEAKNGIVACIEIFYYMNMECK